MRFCPWGFINWWGGGFMMFFWLIIFVGIIYFIINNLNKHKTDYHRSGYRREDRAIEIIRERYAKGEISKEEMEKKLRDLQK